MPVIGFCAHVDTVDVSLSPEVHPQIIRNYDGGDIILNEALGIIMKRTEHPELPRYEGQDIIVSDGTSVLGADNKSAIANIMTALNTLIKEPSRYHGDIYCTCQQKLDTKLKKSGIKNESMYKIHQLF